MSIFITSKMQYLIKSIISQLSIEAQYDQLKLSKFSPTFLFKPMEPIDCEDLYLSITKEQGEDLVTLIREHNIQNVVEFGTSFGISTLYIAQGIMDTGGSIITTEIIESKAERALQNFKDAGVIDFIDLRVGDALDTLTNHKTRIDLLFLDGWKNLYLSLFLLLESNFHKETIIYVDNANMSDTQEFLNEIAKDGKYLLTSKYHGKAVIITLKK